MNIRVLHPRRSGGHAVIFWLMRSAGGCAFYNSLPLVSRTPKLPRERTGSTAKHLLWSHEDPNRNCPLRQCVSRHDISWLPKPDADIFIVRDFYNYAASKIRTSEKRKSAASSGWRPQDSQVWREFAEMAVASPERCILFNEWLCDETYRTKICTRYDGFVAAPYTNEVPDYGGGSSFTGVAQKASQDDLLRRYVGMEEQVQRACTPDIADLNERLFGWRL